MTRPAAVDSLSAAIGRTTEALGSTDSPRSVAWRFARCWMFLVRFQDSGRALSDLDDALADFDALPPDTPGREHLAAELTVAHLQGSLLTQPRRFDRVKLLAELADQDPDPLPGWPPVKAAVRAFALMYDAMNGATGFDLRAAQAELAELTGVVGTTEPHATIVQLAQFAMRLHAMVHRGDLLDAAVLIEEMPRMVERFRAAGISMPQIEFLISLVEVQEALARYDVTALARRMESFRRLSSQLPPGHVYRERMESIMNTLESMLPMFMPGGRWDPVRWVPTTPEPAAVPPVAPLPPPDLAGAGSPQEEAFRWHSAGMRELMADPDSVDRLTRAVEYLGQAVEASPEQDPRRPAYLLSLGVALVTRYEVRSDRFDLLSGIEWLERARDRAGLETHRVWTEAANPLAYAYRLAGRREVGRATALNGLRGHAWNALLQSRKVDVATAARNAVGDAITAATWCLDDGDATGAAIALDAGRALILFAATWQRDIESQLTRLGERDLAGQWRRALDTGGVENVPASLRQQVIDLLAGAAQRRDERPAGLDTAASRLLDPPSLHEVRAALSALHLDALVYLMPGEELTGAAVIVPAADGVGHVLLPRLTRNQIEDIESQLVVVSRGLASARGSDQGQRRDLVGQARRRLDDVCEWAWDAAVGPLLDRHLTASVGPVRLAIIAMGELSRVPWHAAAHTTGGRREYALSRASFSYVPSARMLCAAAWRHQEAGAEGSDQADALILSDPDTSGLAPDLPAARAEAEAIRDVFYPTARYLGRTVDGRTTPDGEGTVDQVIAWLSGKERASVMHLAAHGEARTGVSGPDDSSYLLLAGRPGRLVAESLINLGAGNATRQVDLAVLAGCRTGESTRGYDEAFSIGTALLAAGVGTVISSQWSVPDDPTSVLMFLFHHYLRREAMRPAEALRQAQLSLIEGRPLPASAPDSLVGGVVGEDLSDILNWAGFFHSGR